MKNGVLLKTDVPPQIASVVSMAWKSACVHYSVDKLEIIENSFGK